MEYNLVEIWLRKDPVRWMAGVLSGLVAGALAILVGMVLSSAGGLENWFPVKLMATIFLGSEALRYGPTSAIVVGVLTIEALGAFWGFIFAHFTGTNRLSALLAMGLVWAAFTWIFNWNLFFQSFRTIFAARVPSGPAFAVCLAFGLGMASLSFIDPLLRGKKRT